MRGNRGLLRHAAAVAILALAVLVVAPGVSRAQYFGYGAGYGFPAGYGMYGGYYGYGYPAYGYGYPAYGYGYGYGYPAYGYGYGYPMYGYPAYGYGYGYPAFGYGYGYPTYGYGYPAYGVGYGYGYPAGYAYGGLPFAAPYLNPLFGVGLSPLGVQSYFVESNLLGRGQLAADQRARLRNSLYGRR